MNDTRNSISLDFSKEVAERGSFFAGKMDWGENAGGKAVGHINVMYSIYI